MQNFISKHNDKITGNISAFDRIIFKGYLPIGYPQAMEGFLYRQNILFKNFKNFAKAKSEELKQHAMEIARENNRPYIYLNKKTRKEEYVHSIAEKDNITKGLICVLSCVEENPGFGLQYGEKRPHLVSKRPKCNTFYFYYMDEVFGFMHVRISGFLPFMIQICMNGHEWLAHKMTDKNIDYEKINNAFVYIENCQKAQTLANKFIHMKWHTILRRYAYVVNPFMKTLLKGMEYYWVIDQAEFATDIIFTNGTLLSSLYQKLEQHAVVCFRAEDVMTYLGRKLHGNFQGEIGNHFKNRWPGSRVKHRMKCNWIKMYDKHGCILRVETVINHPYEFRIRRMGKRNGEMVMGWYPMAKRVSNLYRYAEVSLSANKQYIDALSVVDDPTEAYSILHQLCEPVIENGYRRRGLNPLKTQDAVLFYAALRGEYFIHGFAGKDFAKKLGIVYSKDIVERKRQSAKISRLLQLLRAHKLIAKIPRSRKYRLTIKGVKFMSAIIFLRENTMPKLYMP